MDTFDFLSCEWNTLILVSQELRSQGAIWWVAGSLATEKGVAMLMTPPQY